MASFLKLLTSSAIKFPHNICNGNKAFIFAELSAYRIIWRIELTFKFIAWEWFQMMKGHWFHASFPCKIDAKASSRELLMKQMLQCIKKVKSESRIIIHKENLTFQRVHS